MSIKLKLDDGFENLLHKIEKAGGSITAATRECMEKSADIMEQELKDQMQASGVDSDLISQMNPREINTSGNRVTASVGYKKGAYDPDNLSAGYKVIFLNYGTPRRTKYGQVKALGFINRAKKRAKRLIKAEQQKTLTEILKGIEK